MATATSAWAKPGAWALESEQQTAIPKPESDPSPDFPSLAAAAASKSSKKKKPQPQSLVAFAGNKPAEILNLPTGPRERTAEELERTSRGFNYSRGDDSRRSGVSRDETRSFSRADEADDWGSTKRFERKEKVGFFDTGSRADEVESWVSKRSGEKRFGFDSWGRKKEEALRAGGEVESWGRRKEEALRAGGEVESWGRRKEEALRAGAGAEVESWGRKREEANGGGGGRPRLVLQPRTLPIGNGSVEGSCEGSQGEKNGEIGSRKGSNLFGFARPREEVLAEQGKDWKKIEEKMEEGKVKERVVDELVLGKKGWGSVNGGSNEDRTERSWRKEVASDAIASMYGFFFTSIFNSSI